MSAIRAVISDFGGVLTSPLFEAFTAVQAERELPLEALGKALGRAAEADGENPLFRLERGELTEEEFLTRLEDGLREELGREISLDGFSESYFAALTPNCGLFDYYAELRDRELRLALCTNNVSEWSPRWRSMLPFDDVFEVIVDSSAVGTRKPEPRIYEVVLERLCVAGESCVFVDDVDLNCAAAERLGLRPVLFETTAQTIRAIEQLLTRQ